MYENCISAHIGRWLRKLARCSLLYLLMMATGAFAQQNVTGKVTDENDSPLPGVNVTVKGVKVGTMTDFDGLFSVEVPATDAVLVFTYVGYKKQEINVEGKSTLNVTLREDISTLDEVVVVGYGTQVRRDVTGSISSLDEKSFSPQANTNVDQMIQGKAAGVQVVQNSGEPGGGMSINIRGVGSINAGSAPLYVIDGLPINNQPAISQTGNQVAATRSPRKTPSVF